MPAPAISRLVRVAAFTGGMSVPSARFRVRQYIRPLASYGIAVHETWPGFGAYPPRNRALRPTWIIGTLMQRVPQLVMARHADVVILQREMVSTLSTLEGFTPQPRLVDIDDSVHLHRDGRAAQRLAAIAALVVVGNNWLAEVWRQWSSAVEVLPTPVDTDRYYPRPFPERPVIGWIGSAGNLRYLAAIASALQKILRRFPEVTIMVCCDRPPELASLPIRYVPWTQEVEADFLASITIGVMPLADGPWERGKCSFKMLQYMAAGRPCVVSPVGMNKELLGEAELGLAASDLNGWTEALSGLLADRIAAERMGAAGRAVATARYSVHALAPRLAGLIYRLV